MYNCIVGHLKIMTTLTVNVTLCLEFKYSYKSEACKKADLYYKYGDNKGEGPYYPSAYSSSSDDVNGTDFTTAAYGNNMTTGYYGNDTYSNKTSDYGKKHTFYLLINL